MSVPVRLLEERASALEVKVLESALDEPPPADLLERTLVTVGVTAGLAAAGATAQAASAAGAGARVGAVVSGLSLAKWLGIGLIGGLAIGGVQGARAPVGPPPEAPRAGVQRAVAGGIADVRRSAGEPAAAELPSDAQPAAAPEGAAGHFGAAAAPASSSPDLLAEVALLDAARQALHGGDARRALALLDQHAREFPAGRLRPEAEVTRIEAVAKSDPKAASALARAFLARHPASPHAERVGTFVRSP